MLYLINHPLKDVKMKFVCTTDCLNKIGKLKIENEVVSALDEYTADRISKMYTYRPSVMLAYELYRNTVIPSIKESIEKGYFVDMTPEDVANTLLDTIKTSITKEDEVLFIDVINDNWAHSVMFYAYSIDQEIDEYTAVYKP